MGKYPVVKDALDKLQAAHGTGDKAARSGQWSAEEDQFMKACVTMSKVTNFRQIANYLPGRTASQCAYHWRNVLTENIRKGKGSWTSEEDKLLASVVEEKGAKNWATSIAVVLANRTGKQCRERWCNHLNPQLKRTPWTLEEENQLKRLHATHGNKWAEIARDMHGRSDNQVKNHWYAALRKASNATVDRL
jgi:myb proto-oncogene protein